MRLFPSPANWTTGGAIEMPSARQRTRIPALVAASWDDLAALRRRADAVSAERAAAEAAMLAADTGDTTDYPAHEKACEDFDRADDELVLVERRIDELEEEDEWAALREQRREYWQGVL